MALSLLLQSVPSLSPCDNPLLMTRWWCRSTFVSSRLVTFSLSPLFSDHCDACGVLGTAARWLQTVDSLSCAVHFWWGCLVLLTYVPHGSLQSKQGQPLSVPSWGKDQLQEQTSHEEETKQNHHMPLDNDVWFKWQELKSYCVDHHMTVLCFASNLRRLIQIHFFYEDGWALCCLLSCLPTNILWKLTGYKPLIGNHCTISPPAEVHICAGTCTVSTGIHTCIHYHLPLVESTVTKSLLRNHFPGKRARQFHHSVEEKRPFFF